ncbi:uncharacterized protein LOC132938378 isoform X2 [Metopolophium dirhodum]|uniref:uncharacterized protein LOC132938378 isoform X2 n=1 Tax=Metopolophium dirhodum TaxID=44670 RepID=UPI00298FB3E1|nr:uncharacterized protein LOC132938378 isoform X2 [Metopolophium dirhodum]
MIEQTTLHNILTWVIAVVLFIFQSLNYFIAWIKKYVKHGQKTTTVVTADTTISSESVLNNKNVPENVITVQGLIQKHFDIPLIIAEDEPKVYNFIKSAQLLTSNEICKEKMKIDQFMENLVDDSYVARGLGLITATVGRQSEFYLYSKYDNNFENVVIRLNGRNGEIGQITILSKNLANIVEPKSIPMDYIYDKDRIKVTYTPFAEGVYTLTLVRNSLSICRSPYYISVEKSPTNSRSQIRLGTKKYKPVTKFTKSKHSLETCDNSIPVIEPSKPSICKNILPESEKNSMRTDVMSIVTKFESNSINVQKRVHKSTSGISEKGSEIDMINEITKYSNIPPKTKTDNVHDTYVSDLNSPSIHSKTKSTDKNFWNDVDITYKNSKASDINTIDFESERIMKPMIELNEHVGITKDIPEVKNVSSTRLQPTNSVLVESLKIENLHDVEKHNQTFKTTELMDENKLIEKRLDPTTRIYESEIKCIDDESCITNEVSCFDDEDRKTVVVMDSNEIESNPNDTVIQQITDSAQYNINTPFASVITKITNSICEKCSIQVLKIISEFPRDINITHKNNSNEMRPSFETLLAQPISININIDNMFEQPISATNEHDSEHLLTINPTKIKHIGAINKDIQCNYLKEIEPIDNNSDELCGNINNMSKELMIKQNKHNSKIDETVKDEIFDHCIVPFTKRTIDKHNTKNDELSTNEIMKIKYSTTNEDNVLHSNQFNNNTIHKSDNKMEIQRQHLQKSSEHSIGLIQTNQFHENINKELNHISKESDKPLGTSDLVTINNDKNTNCELVTDELKINNVIIPDENTNIQSSVINNIVLASKEVTLVTTEYKSEDNEDNEEQTNNISYKNVTLTSIQNENQKLMIEKSIEPVLTSFKNKMVEKITQLYLNRDSSNTDNTSTFETHDKHFINNLHEIQINNNANSTEINTKCIETLTSQLKNHIDKNKISEIILDQQKTDRNHLLKYVENIIKTKINPSGLYAHTLGEIKLQTLINTAMNHPNNQQINNEFKNMTIDNDTQDDKLRKINNDEIVQDIEGMLVETPSITIIKNTDELILPKNQVTITTECEIPLINDFDTIQIENTNTDSKQEMQTINVNENDTIVETNAMEIKALQNFQKSHDTKILTPIIELRPTLETRIMNTSELVTVEKNSSKEIQTTIEIIDLINIPEETDAVENIDDKNEYESVKLQFKENVIKIPHLVEKETLNEVVENTSTNTSTKSNSTERVSMQGEIESPGLTKVCSANDLTIERDIIYKLQPPAENIDKPNSQSIPTLDAQVSINAAKVTIGINTSDPQFSNTAITVLIPSKIPLIEDNSFLPKLRIVSTLNMLDAIKISTIPKYSATCDTKITKMELQNTSEPTLSPNKLFMKNRKLEKIENIDETRIPTDTEIETLEYLNKSGKIKSIPPISNDTLTETTVESKTEKNTLHKTLNPKYKVTTLEPTVNDINCNNNKNETTIPISSSTGEIVEKPIKKHTAIEFTLPIYPQSEPNKKVYEMQICTEVETPTVIDNSTASLVRKIVIEFVTNKNKTPIEAIEIIVHEPIEEDIEFVRETTPTMNSLVAVMDEQVNIKKDGSDTYYVKSDDNVTNKGTKTRKSIGQNNAEKIIEKESPVPINTLTGVVMENPKINIITVTAITSCTDSSTETIDVKTDVEKVIEEESPSPMNFSSELVQENMNMNINTENETLLPTESTMESTVEPKIEELTEPEITSCTESGTVITDIQFHAEKIIDEVLIDSLGEVMGENTNMNIVSESEKLLPIVSTEESISEPTVEEDISVTVITSCTDSSTETIDVKTDVEKVIEEESPSPMNSSSELVQENINMNINTENETLLPIESTMESIVEPKIEELTEPEITLCTDSSTETIDVKTDVEKVIEEEPPSPMNSSSELVQENMNMNINTENETLLPIESTMESTVEPKIEELTEPEITSCTESATDITVIQFHPDKIFDEVLIDSLGEVMGENKKMNIVSESEKLLPIVSTEESISEPTVEEDISVTVIKSCTDSSTETIDVKTDVEKVNEEESPSPMNSSSELVQENMNMNINTENETLLPIESTMESTVEPKIEEIIKPEITSCTESGTVITDIQFHADKIFDEVLIDSLGEVMGENTNMNIVSESEKLLPIVSTEESISEPTVEEDISVTVITSCTDSSTETIDVKTDVEKVIEEESPSPMNSSSELVQENINMNINTENETLLPIESTMESIVEPKIEELTEPEITSCTDSSTETIDVKTDVEKVIEEESPVPMNFSSELVQENMNMNINTENETLLPTESTMESTVEPKIEELTEPEITSCTESGTVITDIQFHAEKIIDEVLIDSLGEVMGENTNMNIVSESEKLLPIVSTEESISEPTVEEDISVTVITSCTDSSTETIDVKTDVEKVIEEESPSPMNSSSELVQENMNMNINTENETLLPIESTMESIVEPKIKELTEPEITSCTDSSTETIDVKTDVEKVIEEESPSPMNSSSELVQENMNMNINTENETLLPIESTMESTVEPKIEEITKPEITSCTESGTVITDIQFHADKIFDEVLIDSLGEVMGENTNMNIVSESEKLLPIVSTEESISEPTVEEDISVTVITSCTDSSTETIDVKTDVEKVIEEESPSPMNSSSELVQENMNMNINTENETLLPIESTMESTVEPKIEEITKPEITSCTESGTVITDIQFHADKIFDEVLIDSLGEVMGENTNMNIVSESEKLLPIVSTEESISEPTVEEDISVTVITSCTDSSTETIDVKTDVEKVIEEESPSPMNSSSELVQENINMNINTENETLLPIESTMESIVEPKIEELTEPEITSCTDSSTETIDVKTDVEKVIEEESPSPMNSSSELVQENMNMNINTENETLLPIVSTMESTVEPKIEELTEPEITSCTESSIKIIQYQDHAEKMFDQEAPPDGKSKVIVDTETETHLSIVLIESIEKPNFVEPIIATKIPYCTESSTEITDTHMDQDNVIVEPLPTPINFLSEIEGVKTKVHINTESEALLPMTNYVEEKEVIEETSEIVLPIELAMEFIQEPKLKKDIKIRSCTDYSTVTIQKDKKNVIFEESSTPINSLGEVVEKNMNDKVDKENEIVLPIDSITGSMEEKKEKDGHIDPLLTMKSTVESIKEPKEVEDITAKEITSCTNSSSVILEIQMDEEKVIEAPPVLINSSSKIIGETTKVNMDTEYETILLIESTIESIAEPEINEQITQTKILSCTPPSNATVNVQTDVDKLFIEEVSMAPLNCSDEEVGKKSNVNNHTENETLLPIEFTMETIAIPKTVEDIKETEISSCTDSCILTVDAQTDKEKGLDEVTPEPINSSGEVVAEKTSIDIDTRKETILPINTSTSSVEDRNAIEGTTEIILLIKSTIEFEEESIVVEDINVTEITDLEKVIEEVPTVLMNSSCKIIGEKTKVNIDTEYETILPIGTSIESVEEPNAVKDITETEITSCTESSTENMMDFQSNKEKYIAEKSPVPINSSGKVVVGKTNMNIDNGNETILPIKTYTSSVEDRKAIEGTTGIVLPIEFTMEFKKEPKVVEDIPVTEKTPCTDSYILTVDAQTDVEKEFDEVTPVLFNSSAKIIGEKTKVTIDTEYETILPVKASYESIEEPKFKEPEIKSRTVPSTENMMDVQTNNEKYLAEKCPEPIYSSVEEVGGKSKANIDTEDETLLPVVSTKESIEKTKIEPTAVTETEILSCTESSTIIINYQNHTEKIVDVVPINYLSEVMGENINVNVITENETHLPIGSTMEAVEVPNVVEDITEIEKRSSTESSSIILDTKIYVEKVIEEIPSVLIDPSDKVVGENPKVNMDTEYETILPIELTIEFIPESEIYEDITETEILTCTDTSTGNVVAQTDVEKVIGEVSLTLINSSDKLIGRNINVNIDNEGETLRPIDTSTGYVKDKKDIYKLIETLLPIESTVEPIDKPKVEDITEPEIKSCTESSTEIFDNQNHADKIVDQKHPVFVNSSDKVVGENTNVNIDMETETLLPIGSTLKSIEVSKEVEDIKETETILSTNSFIVTVDIHTDVEKNIDKESPSLINSFGELVQENMNMNINTENETLLPIELTIEPIEESNVVDDRTEIEITSYTEPLTKLINPQFHAEKIVAKVKNNSLVQGNTNVSINTKNVTLLQIDTTTSSGEEMKEIDELIETLIPIKSNMESIKVAKKVEDINEREKISFTDSSILTKDIQTDIDIVIEKKSPTQINFLVNKLGENTKVNNDTENKTILPNESTKELTVEPKVEIDITETVITSCTDSSTVTLDVQTNVEKVIEEHPAPIHSSGEVVGESTKLYIDTVNETLLQIDTSITAVKAVLEKKIIENEYSTPTFSPFLDVEKQINVIIDSKTETIFPIGTNTTFVDEPNVVRHVSENEHAALIDSSITIIKQQIKVDTETEIETLLLIDNLTESIKEQIVEKITENKTPTLIDSLAEMVGEGSKANIDTDNQTLLTINTSSTNVDDQIVNNGIKNETQIYCVVNVAEEQMKVNTETNNKTITPIDIFTTSIEEQLNVEYLCENENTIHIDSVPTLIKNQVATELKGYEILTDTETLTSIDALNTTVDRQTVKENFKEIESRIPIATSTAFEEEQKSVEHITVKENVLSIGTSTASVEEEIQVEEVIENESASLISHSTIHDVASLGEPKVIKNDTTAMRSSVTVVEEQTEVAAAEVVIDTCKESLDKTMIDKDTRHNETPTPIDILVTATEKQTDLEKLVENKIPILVNTSTKSVEKQIKTEKGTENETITLIACEALPKIEPNEFETKNENEASSVNNSASIRIKQTEAENVTETTLRNDDIIYRNTKTNLISTENKTENSDNPNNCYLKFGESSKMHRLENEDNLQRKSYGIQKLEMSVKRMKTSDEDYYEKTFVQLEQTEKISKVDKVNVDDENKTIIDDKLYTVNESDLNAILCASSLEEALTLLDSKIKFKFKHKKSSSKINSVEYIPKIQTSDSNSSGVNTNFTDARKFFKEIEKKSKK